MREDRQQFMRLLGQLPARLTAEQAAWVLNCQPHDVPILVAARLLKPLGNPQPHSVKFFAASELLEQAQDRDMAGQGHECVEPTLAKEKCRQEKLSYEWFDEQPSYGIWRR